MSFLTKIFGDPNEKVLKKVRPIIEKINLLENKFRPMSDEELKSQTARFKAELAQGKTLDDILPEAFAVVREAARRTLGQRHYDVQLIGGIVLHWGQIAEMKTGEGKTLVATLPSYLNALTGAGVHVVTVNDYLSRRDAVWMGQVHNFLGLSVGCIQHESSFVYDASFASAEEDEKRDIEGGFKVRQDFLRPVSRREAYACDILYGTNNEFGFDYLRDNMAINLEQVSQRELNYAIVDEVDSILIDEARTPLIISAPAEESTEQYYQFANLVSQLKENEDYNIDEKMRTATLSAEGISKMEKWLGVDNIYTSGGISTVHHIEQALKAHTLFKIDRDYVVKDGEILIVDEFTGRLMYGRRYSEGLHQAIEAKEGVEIKRESQTMATITFQNLFRLYKKLSGMTGTAVTEAEEFSKIYKLEVSAIPTNKPMIRRDYSDKIYKTEMGKFTAVAKEIKERHTKGQPVLVGTISIEKNEMLSEILEREGVPHQVLNAKHHEKEAEIIAQAGRLGAVTIATNMAGRGVDIVLGGNPPNAEEAKKVCELGGLCVIGTERHESRRIDNQLRGRAGRQGDPGATQFYLSLEDDLMRIFGSDRLKSIMTTLKVPEDMPIQNGLVSKSIESAQTKVEGHHFDIRKHLVEYDDVLNKQREAIYRRRREVLQSDKERETILAMVKKEIEQIVLFHTAHDEEKNWDLEEIKEAVSTIFPLPDDVRLKLDDLREKAGGKEQDAQARDVIINYLYDLALASYKKMAANFSDPALFVMIEKNILLRAIDSLWVEHLDAMSYMRTGIGLRGYGQRDPLVEYKKESFRMYNELVAMIEKEVVYSIYKVGLAQAALAASPFTKNLIMSAPAKTSERTTKNEEGVEKVKKVGRNDPCPCGATKPDGTPKKYKHCCGKNS
ncbi:MAG: preprotein translocase subunit SecA [Patescibacteria group bacterium]|nr:preprotein translocase subunit SecA [Patescibacteria group bacterium]MDD5490523.1 preprotein translocase subunit SecA [Patescibacteria group bacterium]